MLKCIQDFAQGKKKKKKISDYGINLSVDGSGKVNGLKSIICPLIDDRIYR